MIDFPGLAKFQEIVVQALCYSLVVFTEGFRKEFLLISKNDVSQVFHGYLYLNLYISTMLAKIPVTVLAAISAKSLR